MLDNRRQFLRACGGAVAASGLVAGCLSGGEEYPSDTMTFIVPYSSGGGFDSYTRAIAEFLPNYLPNDVETAVENRPGAGGVTGATAIYQADPDGYTAGIFNNPGMVVAQIVQDVNYDMSEMSWIAQIASASYALAVHPDSEYETVSDLQEADEVSFAETGPGSVDFVNAVIATNQLEINSDHVTGYEGSTEKVAAVLRGDVDIVMTSANSLATPIEDGELRPVVVFDDELPDFAPSETETIADAGYPDLVDLIGFQRLFGGPPEIPEERLEILRDSVMEMLNSDEFQQWSEDNDRPVVPREGSEVNEMLEQTVETYSQYVDILSEAITE